MSKRLKKYANPSEFVRDHNAKFENFIKLKSSSNARVLFYIISDFAFSIRAIH